MTHNDPHHDQNQTPHQGVAHARLNSWGLWRLARRSIGRLRNWAARVVVAALS